MFGVGRWPGLGPGFFVGVRGGGRPGRLGRLAVVACLLAAALPACGGGSDGSGRTGATVPKESTTSSSSSTTTAVAAIDITKKPDVVTVAYADAVMDELDRLLSDAIRDFVANDGPTKRFDDLLNAVYDEPSLENKRSVYGKFAIGGADEFRKPPGDVVTSVREILKNEPSCVVLFVDRDFSAQIAQPRPDARKTGYIALAPTVASGDPVAANPTPLSIVFDGNVLEGEDPRAAC